MPSGNFSLIYNKEYFINYDLAKSYYGVTDQQLMTFSVMDALETKAILGKVFIKLQKHEFLKVVSVFTNTTQDLDESLCCLVEPNIEDKHECFLLPKGTPCIELQGIKFTEFKNLKMHQKYNKRDKIPHIKLCGSLFVAIGYVFYGEESYLIKIEEEV